jgi:hypothetical protein
MKDQHPRRRIALLGGAALLLAFGASGRLPHPSANIEILTHDSADTAPARIRAALDLGVLAVSVLVTWTKVAHAD